MIENNIIANAIKRWGNYEWLLDIYVCDVFYARAKHHHGHG
jgi:hypothetical protein